MIDWCPHHFIQCSHHFGVATITCPSFFFLDRYENDATFGEPPHHRVGAAAASSSPFYRLPPFLLLHRRAPPRRQRTCNSTAATTRGRRSCCPPRSWTPPTRRARGPTSPRIRPTRLALVRNMHSRHFFLSFFLSFFNN